jgi:hypothetical protein
MSSSMNSIKKIEEIEPEPEISKASATNITQHRGAKVEDL